jgi:hypothetical protein
MELDGDASELSQCHPSTHYVSERKNKRFHCRKESLPGVYRCFLSRISKFIYTSTTTPLSVEGSRKFQNLSSLAVLNELTATSLKPVPAPDDSFSTFQHH